VLTGHGCFGEYLQRIGKERTARCHHCAGQDSAQHTLEECPAWDEEREDLTAVMGQDLSLPTLISLMLRDKDRWRVALSFCEEVIKQKERAEWERRGRANHGILILAIRPGSKFKIEYFGT
jgi:hypothetical protein